MARGKRAAATDAGPVEGLWPLPHGWKWERLGSLGTWYGGGTPSKANDAFWTDGDIPWVSPKDMKVAYLEDSEDHITVEAVAGSSTKMVPAGSVVCVMRSGILRHSFPVAVTRREVTLNQDLRALHPREGVLPEFLAFYLNAVAQAVLHGCSKDGTTVNSIDTDRLMAWPVPICSVEEQARVVEVIQALFDQIQDGEEAMEAADEASSGYREAVLKAAVCGDLTEDWRQCHPDCGTGADLLVDLTDKAVGSKARNVRTDRPATNEDDLPELPSSWTWATVGQLGAVVTGATPATSRADFYGGDVAFFTPTDLNDGFGLSASRRTITEAGLASIRPIAANSVMVTCIGATIGKTGHTLVAGATNQQINSVVPWTPDLAPYLFAYFSGPVGRSRVIEASSSTTMPILNKGDFSHLPVPLPPRAELVEINARLEVALNRQDELSEAINELASSPATLRQSILSAAFRGTLAKHVQ